MAKFPTEVTERVSLISDGPRVYAYLWDVVGSSTCIPGLERCERVGENVYRFRFEARSTGPVSLVVRYTARYTGNGTDEIRFESIADPDDNTDVTGVLRLHAATGGGTDLELTQTIAPDTPVPRLLQGFIRSFVQRETAEAAAAYLANVKRTLETQPPHQRS